MTFALSDKKNVAVVALCILYLNGKINHVKIRNFSVPDIPRLLP